MTDQTLPPTPGPDAPSEPLIPVAAVTAFAVAALALFVAFGAHLSSDQRGAILGVIAPLGVIVTAVWSRLKVYSPASVHALLQRAKEQRATRTTMPYTKTGDVYNPGGPV